MKIFENSQWIWTGNSAQNDEYGEFFTEFFHGCKNAILNISADSNYAVYINGELATFGQYADYPYDKVYDSVDITKYCKDGKNSLAVLVWYYGLDTSSVYYPGKAGVIFEISEDGKTTCHSGEHIMARKSPSYKNHYCKGITVQLGYSFLYDATHDDNWKNGELSGFAPAHIIDGPATMRIRPCKKLELLPPVQGKKIKEITDTDILFDLGINTVGFLSVKIESPCEQKILISYGEHIEDGCVRRLIGHRDFSVELVLKKGVTEYTNHFRRLGCKYLEIFSEVPLKDAEIAIVPTVYPVKEQARPEKLSQKQNAIYDACVRTLTLCMHEHYEDCPWREQALYTMDSRNQMLIGYYAFKEFEFPRANLELISKDNQADGLLSITYPVPRVYKIPSFSLHYFTQCEEYLDYSGDKELIAQVYPKLCSVMDVFVRRMNEDDGCVLPYSGKDYWNFYEWCNQLDGYHEIDATVPDIILNALLSVNLAAFSRICDKAGLKKPYDFDALIEKLNSGINKNFFDKEKKIYFDRTEKTTASVLGNCLAILCGAASDDVAKDICTYITGEHELTPISLSMKCFCYDALLKADREKYKDYIIAAIEKTFTPMLEYGTGTVWETEDGCSAFDDAGSLCHGWSALPIYYYHTLL